MPTTLCIGWWSRQTDSRGIFMAENGIAVPVLFSVKPEFSETFCGNLRSDEHTSELQSLKRISYAVFCFKTTQSNTPGRIYTFPKLSQTKTETETADKHVHNPGT